MSISRTPKLTLAKINATESRVPRLDSATHVWSTIDYEHHEIHGGSHYIVASFTNLAAAGTVNFCATTTDSSLWTHFLWEIQSTNETQLKLFEGAGYGTDGTVITPLNSDRNSTKISTMDLRLNATITTAGTAIMQQAFGVSGTPVTSEGGQNRATSEVIFKQGSSYVIQAIAIGASLISYTGHWYEHTNKD